MNYVVKTVDERYHLIEGVKYTDIDDDTIYFEDAEDNIIAIFPKVKVVSIVKKEVEQTSDS